MAPVELNSEVRALLTEGQRIGKLATTRKNGNPWIQPLWFILDGAQIRVVVTSSSITAKSLRRTGRATLCVDDEELPYRFVVLECRATVDDSQEAARCSLTAMLARYRPDIDAPAEIAMYQGVGVVIATLEPERVFYMPQVVDLHE